MSTPAGPSPWPLNDGIVVLRPPRPGEEAVLIAGRDAEWQRWLGPGVDQPRPTAVILVEDQIVGWVDYDTDRDWLGPDAVNVGYNVFAPYRRRGYAARAVRLLLDYLRDHTGYRRANLVIDVDNAASLGVVRAVGAVLVESNLDEAGRVSSLRHVVDVGVDQHRPPLFERPRLETARLVLRPLAISDAREMAGVVADPELYAFTNDPPPTLEELTDMYRRLLTGPEAEDEWWGNWVLVERMTDRLVGVAQASVWMAAGGRAEVAWVVGTAHQGQGLAKEAASALVGWLRSLPLARIEANIHPDHAASAAVAASCGLQRTLETVDGEVVWRRARGGGDSATGA